MKREVNDLLSVDRLVRKLGIGELNPNSEMRLRSKRGFLHVQLELSAQ